MSGFATQRAPRDGWKRCHNDHLTQGGMPAKGTVNVAMAGHPTLLCEDCARAWRRVWDGAVGDRPEPEVEPEAVPA